jgi:hypothetical protein
MPSAPTLSTAHVRGGRLQRKPLLDPAPELRRKPLSWQPPLIQAKLTPGEPLTIGRPGDMYEQEADRVAEQVMRMPQPHLQRQTEPEEEDEETLQTKPLAAQITPLVQRQEAEGEEREDEEEEPIQAKPLAAQITPLVQRQEGEGEEEEEEEQPIQAKPARGSAPRVGPGLATQIRFLKGGGRPLSRAQRGFFEPRFGYDFGRVRVHTDNRAIMLARSVNARAFLHGSDICFNQREYCPATTSGKRLLAHELVHVVQQGRSQKRVRYNSAIRQQFAQRLETSHDGGCTLGADHNELIRRVPNSRQRRSCSVPKCGPDATVWLVNVMNRAARDPDVLAIRWKLLLVNRLAQSHGTNAQELGEMGTLNLINKQLRLLGSRRPKRPSPTAVFQMLRGIRASKSARRALLKAGLPKALIILALMKDAGQAWTRLVKPGARYDFKAHALRSPTRGNCPSLNCRGTITLCPNRARSNCFSADLPGNLVYSRIGQFVGWSRLALQLGSQYAQLTGKPPKWDTPQDTAAIYYASFLPLPLTERAVCDLTRYRNFLHWNSRCENCRTKFTGTTTAGRILGRRTRPPVCRRRVKRPVWERYRLQGGLRPRLEESY